MRMHRVTHRAGSPLPRTVGYAVKPLTHPTRAGHGASKSGDQMTARKNVPVATTDGTLQENQEFAFLFASECLDGARVFAQHSLNICRRTVSTLNPHYKRQRTGNLAALLKIRIFGHNCVAVRERILPNRFVSFVIKTHRLDVR